MTNRAKKMPSQTKTDEVEDDVIMSVENDDQSATAIPPSLPRTRKRARTEEIKNNGDSEEEENEKEQHDISDKGKEKISVVNDETKKSAPNMVTTESPGPSSGVKVPEAGGSIKQTVNLQNLETHAKTTVVYQCKMCPGDVMMFTRLQRDGHIFKYHQDCSDYNVHRHQEEKVMVQCIQCPHLAIPWKDWDQHLQHHQLSTLLPFGSMTWHDK